jgi:hypothetical protein
MVGVLFSAAAGWTFVVSKNEAVHAAASSIVVFANHGCTLLICATAQLMAHIRTHAGGARTP